MYVWSVFYACMCIVTLLASVLCDAAAWQISLRDNEVCLIFCSHDCMIWYDVSTVHSFSPYCIQRYVPFETLSTLCRVIFKTLFMCLHTNVSRLLLLRSASTLKFAPNLKQASIWQVSLVKTDAILLHLRNMTLPHLQSVCEQSLHIAFVKREPGSQWCWSNHSVILKR